MSEIFGLASVKIQVFWLALWSGVKILSIHLDRAYSRCDDAPEKLIINFVEIFSLVSEGHFEAKFEKVLQDTMVRSRKLGIPCSAHRNHYL